MWTRSDYLSRPPHPFCVCVRTSFIFPRFHPSIPDFAISFFPFLPPAYFNCCPGSIPFGLWASSIITMLSHLFVFFVDIAPSSVVFFGWTGLHQANEVIGRILSKQRRASPAGLANKLLPQSIFIKGSSRSLFLSYRMVGYVTFLNVIRTALSHVIIQVKRDDCSAGLHRLPGAPSVSLPELFSVYSFISVDPYFWWVI